MITEVVTVQDSHVDFVVNHIRKDDANEITAACNQSIEFALKQSILLSERCWTGLVDGQPVCIFGVVSVSTLYSIGRPWMFGTVLLDKYAKPFLKRCRHQVEQMQRGFDLLENYVDCRNKRAINWLKWLGFSFNEPELMGPFNLPFMRFYRGSDA